MSAGMAMSLMILTVVFAVMAWAGAAVAVCGFLGLVLTRKLDG